MLAFGDERVEVSREHADALVEYLWKGLLPGSATCAAKLTEALAAAELPARRALEFQPYETEAIRGALEALGLVSRS
jgi:hypothetical protein